MSHNQPGPYGRKPRRTGPVVAGAVVALAGIAGGAYLVFGGDGDDGGGGGMGGGGVSNSEVAAATKGYELVPPESVGAYEQTHPGSGPARLEAEAEELGVENAKAVTRIYNAESTATGGPPTIGGKRLTFRGIYGEIADPAEALDDYFAGIPGRGIKGKGKGKGVELQLVGSAVTVKPAGFEGALMKCQDVMVTHGGGAGGAQGGYKDYRFPVCAWADYSTVGSANVFVLVQPKTGGKGASQDEVAELAAELYKTARRKG